MFGVKKMKPCYIYLSIHEPMTIAGAEKSQHLLTYSKCE